MAARSKEPDVDEDRNSFPPPEKKILEMEIEEYEYRLRKMNKAGWEKTDTALVWMEIALRKDMFRVGQADGFEGM